jgi:kynureninase
MKHLLEEARARDARDELRDFRNAFWIPARSGGGEQAYLCGHSLGLQPRQAETAVLSELRAWRERAVGGHFRGQSPDHPAWIDFGDDLARDLAGLVRRMPTRSRS